MTLDKADQFVFESLNVDLKRAVMTLADADLGADRPGMDEWMGEYGASEYRDLELTLDLLGNLDAPL